MFVVWMRNVASNWCKHCSNPLVSKETCFMPEMRMLLTCTNHRSGFLFVVLSPEGCQGRALPRMREWRKAGKETERSRVNPSGGEGLDVECLIHERVLSGNISGCGMHDSLLVTFKNGILLQLCIRDINNNLWVTLVLCMILTKNTVCGIHQALNCTIKVFNKN